MPAQAAIGTSTVQAQPAPSDAPETLRAAVELAGQHFGFTVIGAGRIGTDAPEWPAEDLPADSVIGTLLKDYSYIVLLKPETAPGGRRDPETLVIVGLNHPPADTPASAPAPVLGRAPPTPAAARSAVAAALPVASTPTARAPSWAPPPSTVVRTLTKLAETNGNSIVGTDQTTQPTVPMANPAENAAAMAALTRSAQSGLGALVTGLRQACPNPKAC